MLTHIPSECALINRHMCGVFLSLDFPEQGPAHIVACEPHTAGKFTSFLRDGFEKGKKCIKKLCVCVKHRGEEEEEDWKYLLWASLFSLIPSTPPSDLILKKKPPFLQYSLLGSLNPPGVKPPLPPSSGVEGSVAKPAVAIILLAARFPGDCLVSLWSGAGEPAVASHHLPPTAAGPPPPPLLHRVLHGNPHGASHRPPHPLLRAGDPPSES